MTSGNIQVKKPLVELTGNLKEESEKKTKKRTHVLVISPTTPAQRAFHDFIFQACSRGRKTSRNPTRVQSIPELLYMLLCFCRGVISLWICQLLSQKKKISRFSAVHTSATVLQRQRGADEEKRTKEDVMIEQKGAAVPSCYTNISTLL